MLGKLLTIILGLGLTGAALLEARQRHINLTYEMTVAHQRNLRQERSLWELRRAIAVRCRPGEIRRLLEDEDPTRWRVITVPDDPPISEVRLPEPSPAPVPSAPRLLIGPLATMEPAPKPKANGASAGEPVQGAAGEAHR